MKLYTGEKASKALILFILAAAIFILLPQGAQAITPQTMTLTAFPSPPDEDTSVRLEWDSVPGANTYQLLRAEGNAAAVEIAVIDTGSVLNPFTYTDTGLTPATNYTYIIKAFSDGVTASPLDQKTAPITTTDMIKPYDIKAVYDINSKYVALNWKSSAAATHSIILLYEGDTLSKIYNTLSTFSVVLPLESMAPQSFYIVSSDGIHMSKSDAIPVTPIEPPFIEATAANGTTTITWKKAFPQIGQFQLERSKWNEPSWGNWSTVNGSLSGTSVTDTPSEGGQYRYRLGAKEESSYSGYSNISGNTSGLPAPTGLTLSIASSSRIDLSWANGAGNTASIQVMRKQADGTFAVIATLPPTAVSTSDAAITVTPGTVYTYRVRAYETPSNYSASAEASISATLPAAPSPLYANVVSTSAVTLNWADKSSNETGFRIERLTDSGTFTEIGTVAADTTTYTDTAVSTGHTYIYRVRSYNALGNSAYSNEVTIDAWDAIVPDRLTVTPVSATRLDLSWGYSGTSGYKTIIERKTGTDGTWSVIYTSVAGALKYSDTGLSPNTRYFYRVRKAMGTGASGMAYPNNDIGIGAYTLLGNLTLTGSAASGNTIYLTWSGNTGSTDVVIERKMSSGAFSALTTVSSSTTGWYDTTGLVPGAYYTYRIKAKSSTNESVYSNELTVQNLYMEAPSSLSVTVSSNSAIELNWKDNSSDETGFEIWRSVYGSGTYALFATVGKNVTTYTDTTVQAGVQYYYMVRAYTASGSLYSPYSNTASVGVGLINPPSNLYYTYISSSQVLLRWTDTSDNESGFKLEWKIGAEGNWNIYTWLSPNVTAYTVSNLNPYTKYYFRVRAYSSTGNADSLSSEILVSTAIPAAPSELKASASSASQIKLTWKDNSDSEDGFRIFRKPANAYYFEPLAEVGKNITSYTDGSLTAGMRYYYKVAAYNATGSSESSEVEVRTNTKATFSDLGSSASWAREAIENLAGLGIMKGVTATKFMPNNTVSKAEFTAMVVRAFKLDTAPVGSMADVKLNKWYYREVMIAENFGIISGDEKNRFYPEAAITREEIAVMLFKALEHSGKEYAGHDHSVLEKFADKNMVSPHALASMATLVGEGIMEGLPGSAIGPKYTATRAQAAVFLYRALNK